MTAAAPRPVPAAGAREIRFDAADGFSLAKSLLVPAGDVRASVLLNPAMAVRREYYAPRQTADWLATSSRPGTRS